MTAAHSFYGKSGLAYRLRWMLLGWGAVGCAYFGAAFVQSAGTVISPSWLDNMVPYAQWAIWPYLSFFILVPYAYLRCEPQRVRPLARSMQLSAFTAAVIYVLWPTAMAPNPADADAVHGQALRLLVFVDTANNCLPSLHAALSLLAVRALRKPGCCFRNAFLLAWFAVISISIVMLRRHLFIDWGAGCLLALCAAVACDKLPGKRSKDFDAPEPPPPPINRNCTDIPAAQFPLSPDQGQNGA